MDAILTTSFIDSCRYGKTGKRHANTTMPYTLTVVVAFCFLTSGQAFEVEERWQRGNAEEAIKIQTGISNVVAIRLFWRNEAYELYERALSSNEMRHVASLVAGFGFTTNVSGSLGKEKMAGVFLKNHLGEEKAQLQLDLSESGKVFAAFHTAKSYDMKRRCFECLGGPELVRELARKPGSRKKETPQLMLPPRRNGPSR